MAVHGRRALVEGYAGSGLEVWAYPVQIADGYCIGFRAAGASTEIDGRALLRRITYTPEAITRTYIGPDFVVEERLFVPLQLPGALITYTLHSRKSVDIVVHFHPVLNLMWPAAAGGQSTQWDVSASAYRLSEPLYRFSALVGSRETVEHDPVFNSEQPVYGPGKTFTVRPREMENVQQATVFLAANDGTKDPAAVADAMLRDRPQLEAEATTHYAQVLDRSLAIETPDARLNRDLAWAAIALDQAWVTNPQLGSGQLGGYGASRTGRRPQYAWFFANDALIAIHALLVEGELPRAREALAFLIKYQDPKTGMMWHELSQSAGYLDWAGKYPYMFVHVDITFDYLVALDDYLYQTGDTAFLTEHWASIDAAYHYCQSVIGAEDGLPHVPANKEAANEQDRLGEELTLSASWVKAAEAYAHLAAATGHNAAIPQARQASNRARRAVAARYWNNRTGFWIDGFTTSGSPVNTRSSQAAGVLEQNIFTPQQTATALAALASPVFQTDWGARSYASDSSAYDPDAYAKGSVWAIGTARLAQVFWSQRMPYPAWQTWSALPAWSSLDSLGHLPEVLAGDYYHEEFESVPEQTWSSSGFLSSTIQGLLGIDVDAQKLQLQFAPHLPESWDHLRLERLRFGTSTLSLRVTRKNGELMLDAENAGPLVHLLFSPEIAAGATLSRARWNDKAVPVKLNEQGEETQAHFDLAVPPGNSRLEVRMDGGIAILLQPPRPLLGAASHEPRILHARLDGTTYTITAAVPEGSGETLTLNTPWTIQNVQGASLSTSDTVADTYTLNIPAGPDHGRDSTQANATGYRTQVVAIHLARTAKTHFMKTAQR
ncbi:MAG: MGH1-like glycoside hydrolase domain-containing protein [Acidobacteriaceae bacterium]